VPISGPAPLGPRGRGTPPEKADLAGRTEGVRAEGGGASDRWALALEGKPRVRARSVEGLSALGAGMCETGVTIETSGCEPAALGDGRQGLLVCSPDGLLVELIEY
jgi:hypothetical protein